MKEEQNEWKQEFYLDPRQTGIPEDDEAEDDRRHKEDDDGDDNDNQQEGANNQDEVDGDNRERNDENDDDDDNQYDSNYEAKAGDDGGEGVGEGGEEGDRRMTRSKSRRNMNANEDGEGRCGDDNDDDDDNDGGNHDDEVENYDGIGDGFPLENIRLDQYEDEQPGKEEEARQQHFADMVIHTVDLSIGPFVRFNVISSKVSVVSTQYIILLDYKFTEAMILQ